MDSRNSVANKKKDLKVLYHHWFPNEKLDGLVLHLQKPPPSKLTDINMIQPIISSYNKYLTYFVKDLLNLLDPRLPKQVCEKICKLTRLISAPEKFPVQPSEKVYTVEDLKSEESVVYESITRETVDVSLDCTQHQYIDGIWKIAAKHNWGSCPIGKVPWQHVNLDIDME